MGSDKFKLRKSIYATLSFVSLIWLVKIIEYSFDLDFSQLGILPRTLEGSIGIITAPLVHGDVFHLLSNTFPILVLGVGLFYFYDKIALPVIILIYLITGFWVWIAARDAYHVGASGLVYGLLSFLLLSGFLRKDGRTLAISFIVLFLYGTTLFAGVFPSQPGVSWESHLMGAVAGIFCAIYFKSSKLSFEEENIADEIIESDIATSEKYVYHFKNTELKDSEDPQPINFTYTLSNSDKERDEN